MQPSIGQAVTERPEEETLARRIWTYQLSRAEGHLKSVPSERFLAERFEVTRHAVRKSIQLLEDEGKLVRMSRRASVPAPNVVQPGVDSDLSISCVNFIRSNAYSAELNWLIEDYLAGYTEALEAYNIKTRFVICPDEQQEYESLFWQRVPFREQGCVLIARNMPSLLTWLEKKHVPYAVQYAYAYEMGERPPHNRVFVNKVGGGFKAARYLIDHGHRHIGFAGNAPPCLYAKAVYEGYEAAMKTAALSIEPEWLWAFNTNRLDVAVAEIRQRFDPEHLPTAILTGNDCTALAILQVAREHGIAVPDQLSIMGFNDQYEAAGSTPPLTTVRVPRTRLGMEAVKLLMASLNEPDKSPETRVLDCTIIERETVGKPNR